MSASRSIQPIRIAPSILDADFAHLADQIAAVEAAGADALHLDIMDGHFVPNLSIGVPVVEAVARCTDLFLEAHLMVTEPGRYAPKFKEAGADLILFHAEVTEPARELIGRIRDLNAKVGVALNPGTPAEAVLDYLELVDLVLVMTVWPGFGGQKFISDCLPKIRTLSRRMRPDQWLEVDGGVNLETAARVVAAGADTLVAGAAIYRAPDPGVALAGLRRAAGSAERGVEAEA